MGLLWLLVSTMPIDRILIVGFGSIGKRHLKIARELIPDADIRVLRHQVGDEIPQLANGHFFSAQDAVAFAPKMAVIANPAPFHIATAMVLAEAGIHLLIEKPLSSLLSGATQLIKVCEKQKVVLAIGYNLRFLDSLQHYRKLLNDGIIGKILSVRCEAGQYLPSWRPMSDYRQSVSAQSKLGGGALLELSHEIDYLRWIFGDVEWVKATLTRQSALKIDVEDTAHLTLGFKLTLDNRRLIATVNLDLIRHDAVRLCTVVGEKGSLRWNGLTGEVAFYEAGTNDWCVLCSIPHQHDDSYVAEWKSFIECVIEKKLPLITGDDGLEVLKIIEGARLSNEYGGRMFELKDLKAEGVD